MIGLLAIERRRDLLDEAGVVHEQARLPHEEVVVFGHLQVVDRLRRGRLDRLDLDDGTEGADAVARPEITGRDPAFQNRWIPVATIVSPSWSVSRSVAADGVRWIARTGWKPRAPLVVSWERIRSPTWIPSMARGPSIVWTGVPAAKHECEADQLGESITSVKVGLDVWVCFRKA